ncbi:MAG: glucose-6-phosphate isomerase [Acidimicrobiales bacterium]|nr:glucose-6-phosphate isomerase [Hyphomonadaceae bacterium]RZV43364.1 MAG: glucose-6-phosphate isomerase [Acidimicrobiales bacterium]
MANKLKSWKKLENLTERTEADILTLFDDANRATRMSYQVGGLFADFSKQRINVDIHKALLNLAEEADLEGWRAKLFAGEPINTTENRAVLHPALRGVGGSEEVKKQVRDMRAHMRKFSAKVRSEQNFNAIVHIGIGGSDLGPRLCADALAALTEPALELRFAENVDGASINDALAGLDPKSTLVIAVSKSFTTQETLMNVTAARDWLIEGVGDKAGAHMIAVSANRDGAEAFGVASDQIFDFWDWVGGRYSLWSAVGLSLQIAYGPDVFDQMLDGAAEMDEHFRDTPLENNLPVMMALTLIWNRNFLGYPSQAIISYARRLRKFPAFLQQLEMESNGKSVARDGGETVPTCPIVWGDEGTNGQHAFFQLLHQGTLGAPVDFIGVLEDAENRPEHHKALLANLFAQSEALMVGKDAKTVRTELEDKGLSEDEIRTLAPHKMFPGNRPSTTIMLDRLDARALGNLIALYEHKVFVASVIWNINAFDQWGVELGKVLAKTILTELGEHNSLDHHDASTAHLIGLARKSITS